jgi:ectoine hydroxylase-related dioxygenase (phytanoyl-CoA dioxygenase family)
VLADAGLQADLDRDGFVVVPLLSIEQTRRLMALYERYCAAPAASGLYESSRHNGYELNSVVSKAIREEVALASRDVFLPSKLYGGTYMVKSHVDSEVLPLHQDWSVVEEKRYTTVFVWCPLADVSVLNGGLFVLPGSHRYFQSLRSGTYPSDRFILPPELHRHTRDVALRAGEAILYSDSLFHGSHANNGSSDRVVVTARIMEESADLVYFHRANAREVQVCGADEEFYLTHIDALAKGRLPSGARKLYRRHYEHERVTDGTLEAKIRQHFHSTDGGPSAPPLFADPRVQAQFQKDGYVVIDLIGPSEIAELAAFYAGLENVPTPPNGFQVSLDNENPAFVRTVAERLIHTVRDCVDKHFQAHKIFTASFVTKAKHPLGMVPPHQDWTFVDEQRFCSATIWCPLVDVDLDNGALGLIKGSHRLYDHVRPSPSPQYMPPFRDQLQSLFPYLNVVPLRAGQAVVFDNRTLHASPPNFGERTRVAFGIGVTQREAPLRHYYLLPNQSRPSMEGYAVQPEFFYNYNNARLSALSDQGRKPRDLNSIGVFAMTARHYETSRLIENIRAAGNREDGVIAQRMVASGELSHPADPGGRPPSQTADTGRVPFWKVYTPVNIVREIRYRLGRS